jgi:pimeloyl-ACP methyl ester carboxylesterase
LILVKQTEWWRAAARDAMMPPTLREDSMRLVGLLAATASLAAALPVAAGNLTGDGGVSAFYIPEGVVPAKPGTLMRSEPLDTRQSLTNAGRNIRLLYSSTDGLRGKGAVAVSGALYVPMGDPPAGGWPLLAWAHGTVGVADVCAPSWAGRGVRDTTYLNFWLAKGYAVVASDYQGLGTPGGHPYLATTPVAYSILDSVRAAQAGGFGLSRDVVIIGQSQGGGAAFATAGHAPRYAPELRIKGAVATGTPYFSPEGQVALQAARPRDKVDPLLAYNFFALSLLEQMDPAFRPADCLTATALPVAMSITTGCMGQIAQAVNTASLTYNTTFTRDPAERMLQGYELMGYPTLKITTPVFMGTGGKDRDVPPAMQLGLAEDACQAGSLIEAHLYPEADHSGAVNGSTAESSVFIAKAFAGEPIAGNCATLPKPPA